MSLSTWVSGFLVGQCLTLGWFSIQLASEGMTKSSSSEVWVSGFWLVTQLGMSGDSDVGDESGEADALLLVVVKRAKM